MLRLWGVPVSCGAIGGPRAEVACGVMGKDIISLGVCQVGVYCPCVFCASSDPDLSYVKKYWFTIYTPSICSLTFQSICWQV